MTDYTKLVEALRHCASIDWCDGMCEMNYGSTGCESSLEMDAAAAIEALQAQLPKRGEIVRCGECKHHEYEEPGMVYCPKIVGAWVSENWYCADGEREAQDD